MRRRLLGRRRVSQCEPGGRGEFGRQIHQIVVVRQIHCDAHEGNITDRSFCTPIGDTAVESDRDGGYKVTYYGPAQVMISVESVKFRGELRWVFRLNDPRRYQFTSSERRLME